MTTVAIHRATALSERELNELCDAAEAAIRDGGGFGWLKPPRRDVQEKYWRGVMLVPERELYIARLDDMVCGSAQLLRPARNNEAQSFACQMVHAFVAPWARGHGLARGLVLAVERAARKAGFKMLTLDVRVTQSAAIHLYETLGFTCWGTNPRYALVDGEFVAGRYYQKLLDPEPATSAQAEAR
ncbi:MAG: GNAT family N-acetyltransferase [Alphaproteobacteria bacterium]|nr:GNAT family N-acetyltransferase [Alphaproteobacteria bacterium]